MYQLLPFCLAHSTCLGKKEMLLGDSVFLCYKKTCHERIRSCTYVDVVSLLLMSGIMVDSSLSA